ncbi:MAG: glycosyl transferase [Verrucomicrobiales bacterium]|nr:glycosyl transferase [Verrucomicrobiales bacterium]
MSPPEFPISTIDEPLRVSGKYFRVGDKTRLIRAVTFGPFPAGKFADGGLNQLERVRTELGANAIRVYEIPSLDFMHECARVGLRVFITLPWTQHVDFLKERHVLADADQLLLETIRKFRGHPALAGYFVGNEIETTLVRWMGWRRVREQLERLIDLGHANDPDALFSYATYPSTEYLLPRNQDFVSFNLYLETKEAFSSYLMRLQNLAGNKPLLISEFGIDSHAHGPIEQAEILEWHIEEACAAGAAGTTIFAWSDLWQRGGNIIEEWDFGVTDREGKPKPALDVVRETWADVKRPSDKVELPEFPKISVIVCTYKGSATLVECLDSLSALDYPDYEIFLVNDGKDERVHEVASSYDKVRRVPIERAGLSVARNYGVEGARGEIIVYTDDDCIVEPDWLQWVALAFHENPNAGCVGGPNLPPKPTTTRQAVIAAGPGSASHVLLSDTKAEHIPGCNLAVRRDVFDEVEGFDPEFRTAGDDVDFCWRVMKAGYDLGFHPAAFVWHYRRATISAYLRQQIGYGKAEALLMKNHGDRFRNLGGAAWNGQVYEPAYPGGQVLYHGRYGYEPFQLVYPSPDSVYAEICLHILWMLVMVGLFVAGGFVLPLLAVASLMLFFTIRVAWAKARRAVLENEFSTFKSRVWLAMLFVLQGAARSGARVLHGWRHVPWLRSLGMLGGAAIGKATTGWWKLGNEMAFWSEDGIGRDDFLNRVREEFPRSSDDASGKTDIILSSRTFWNWAVVTATEYHEEDRRLTRVRLLARPALTTRLIFLFFLFGFPTAVWLGFGLQSELLTLLIPIVSLAVIVDLVMRIKFRKFRAIATSLGMKKV